MTLSAIGARGLMGTAGATWAKSGVAAAVSKHAIRILRIVISFTIERESGG